MTVTRESRRMSRVTRHENDRDNGRDVRRESRDPYPSRPYPTLLNYVGHLPFFTYDARGGNAMSDDQPMLTEPPTCPDCAALQARLRTLDAKLAAARLALAACREVREARNA